jgi:hypothetical protein
MAAKKTEFQVKVIKRRVIRLTVEGDTDLLTNRVPDHVLDEIHGRPVDQPDETTYEDRFEQSIYFRPDGSYGFPARAFKSAMVKLAEQHLSNKIPGTKVKGTVFVLGNLVPLYNAEPERFDTEERNRSGQLIAVTYARFPAGWRCDLVVQYIPTQTMPWNHNHITNMIYNAGQLIGVGRRRPQCGGLNGTFFPLPTVQKEVADELERKEMKEVSK